MCAFAAPSHAALTPEAAREKLEMLGLPLGPDAFAHAVATKHRSLIDLCFAAHLDANTADENGRTPLLLAALQGDWDTARKLMDAGAAGDVADGEGVTPLMGAAMHGDVEMLRLLIAHRAIAEAADAQSRCALHYAVAAKKFDAVEFLAPLTPDLAARCEDGRTALAMAFESGDARIAQFLLERTPPVAAWIPQTQQALADALGAGDRERIRLLLSKHHAPPAPVGHTAPLLAYAIATEDRPLFDLLLECGADPNAAVPAPAEKAFVELCKSRFLREYLESDSNVTVLMVAAGLGKLDYVKALLAAGAERGRMTPKYKMVALYFATRSDNWLCSQTLLGSGPSPEKLHIEVSISSQEAVVIRDGAQVFKTNVSTGRQGFSTPPGNYVITDKDREHHSTIYKVAMPYFMRLSCRDFGLHEGVVVGHPASHGCIRLSAGAARRLFSEIPVGTLVTID